MKRLVNDNRGFAWLGLLVGSLLVGGIAAWGYNSLGRSTNRAGYGLSGVDYYGRGAPGAYPRGASASYGYDRYDPYYGGGGRGLPPRGGPRGGGYYGANKPGYIQGMQNVEMGLLYGDRILGRIGSIFDRIGGGSGSSINGVLDRYPDLAPILEVYPELAQDIELARALQDDYYRGGNALDLYQARRDAEQQYMNAQRDLNRSRANHPWMYWATSWYQKWQLDSYREQYEDATYRLKQYFGYYR